MTVLDFLFLLTNRVYLLSLLSVASPDFANKKSVILISSSFEIKIELGLILRCEIDMLFKSQKATQI